MGRHCGRAKIGTGDDCLIMGVMGIFSAPRVAMGVEGPEERSTLRYSDTHGGITITYSLDCGINH